MTPRPAGRSDQIADRYVDAYAALDPCVATYVGVPGHDAEMTDYSPDGFAARADLARATLRELAAVPETPDDARVARELLAERLSREVEIADAGLFTSDLNVTASPLQMMRQVFDLMDVDGADAWATIATRLAAVPAALTGYRASLQASAADGRVAARRQVERCAEQCARWSGATGDGFFADLVARSGTDGALRTALEDSATMAAESMAGFGRFLTETLIEQATDRDAVGRDRYALWSAYFTGSTIDLDETYAWGWDELARIDAQMVEVAGRIAPDADVAGAVSVLDVDPARQMANPAALRDWMQQLSDRAVDALADIHFDIPAPVRRLECRIAPTHDGGIYYTGPSEDFTRPGRMWWAVPKGVESFTTWRETTTVFHEGVPGHHLQVAQTAYRADKLNRYRRMLCWVPAHGEGWALYAEKLMADLGFLDDPGDRLGMLDAQAFRAARVIVDIGMHLELPIPMGVGFHDGERWSPELGLEFLRLHCSMDDAYLRDELDRYLGWPAQAPCYKVGERLWLAARDDAERRHGDRFDLKAFHAAALDLGSMGLDLLRSELALI